MPLNIKRCKKAPNGVHLWNEDSDCILCGQDGFDLEETTEEK